MANHISGGLWSEKSNHSVVLTQGYDHPFKIIRTTITASYIWGRLMSYDKPKCHAYLECELWFENVSDETIRGDIFIEYKTIDSALNTKIVESPNDFRSLRRAVIDIGDKHKATTKLGVKLSGFYKLEFRSICIGDKTYNMPFEVNVNFTRTKKFRLLTDRKHIMKFDVEITEGESLISEWETSL